MAFSNLQLSQGIAATHFRKMELFITVLKRSVICIFIFSLRCRPVDECSI